MKQPKLEKHYIVDAEMFESNFPEDDLSKFPVVYLPAKDKQQAIFDKMGEYLSEDSDNYPAIIVALKKELKKNPDRMLDYVEYGTGKNKEQITVWEAVELSFTVETFCNLVGIEL